MRSKIFSTAKDSRYAKRKFYVFYDVSAPCLSQAINFQLLSLLFLPVFGTIYKLVLTSLGFGPAAESILSRVNVEGQFFCYRYI